ncbi:hypothetical protein [Ochrobactrum sp. Marseille-Q0166]|uniref:hypothetical protein n=1 Tax=Ochrobactrum sp. Marseille-Q0166 TaxID=2761105 RepID=UPI001655A1F0|nr:hypothetical protein [Ochrobactrum sp. Marseille-Q0166]MBC8719262.1 hypothetical protein [Ochrobactrum sp. Marseille-Q0166]
MSNRHTHILTADEFIAQGTTVAAILSIARWYRVSDPATAATIKDISYDVSRKTGEKIRMRRVRPANDNRRPFKRRAA